MNEWFKKGRERLEKHKQVLLVIGVGVILMLLPTGSGGERAGETPTFSQEAVFDLDAFEEKLERVLSQVEGAGETRVVLTLDSGNRQVLAQDQEWDETGEVTASVVTLGRGAGEQEVVPLQTLAPRFRGALVVCPGGETPQVRLKLAEAVSALTGLGADCISICKGNP